MRGEYQRQASLLCIVSPEQRVPKGHPLRGIKPLADEALKRLSGLFDEMYSEEGRPSIPPERLLKATLLMALYSVRSERLFCEQLDYNLLFRWFLDMDVIEPSFDHSVFAKNRARLIAAEAAKGFFREVVALARERKLLSAEHFTVDGTLIEAWASLKSFRRKDGQGQPPKDDDPSNPTVDFKGEKRSNATHESMTDPEARLYKKGKGKEAKLSYLGHALMENRQGLLVDIRVTQANGTAERETALAMLDENLPGKKRLTVGGDKAYDTRDFVKGCRGLKVTPHVARNTERKGGSALDERTARHGGYGVSQRLRKRVEEIFGWLKTIGGLRKTRYVGPEKTQLFAYLTGAAYNLLRISRLEVAGVCP